MKVHSRVKRHNQLLRSNLKYKRQFRVERRLGDMALMNYKGDSCSYGCSKMWRIQTNFLLFGRRKLDFGKVLCFDAHILAMQFRSFVSYLSDGITDPKEFPMRGWVSVFGMGCFEAKCFLTVFTRILVFSQLGEKFA